MSRLLSTMRSRKEHELDVVPLDDVAVGRKTAVVETADQYALQNLRGLQKG